MSTHSEKLAKDEIDTLAYAVASEVSGATAQYWGASDDTETHPETDTETARS
jgi:hypothetical protein